MTALHRRCEMSFVARACVGLPQIRLLKHSLAPEMEG